MTRFIPLLLLACARNDEPTDGDPPIDDVDPMVGHWVADSLRQDGETVSLPTVEDDGTTFSLEMDFTAEQRGLLTQIFTIDGVDESWSFEFVVDVFDVGHWLVEIEDPQSDMILDCEAEGDELTCSGTCDGLACTIHLLRAP